VEFYNPVYTKMYMNFLFDHSFALRYSLLYSVCKTICQKSVMLEYIVVENYTDDLLLQVRNGIAHLMDTLLSH